MSRPSSALTVASVLVLAVEMATANRPPLVGNAGYAPYFDWNTRSDALSLHWTAIPTTAITMEFWYMVTDPYLYATTLFSYGAYNAEGRHSAGGGETYEQANEFAVWGNNQYLRFMHGTSRFDCKAVDIPACNIYANRGNWTHFAVSWTNFGDQDGDLGANTMFYINGEQVYNHTFAPGDDAAHSIEPGGVLMLVQEQDAPWGDLEEVQSMTGYIDEFRVWSTVRSSAEIKANYKRSIDMDNDPDATDIDLYWRFDTPGGTAKGDYMVEADLSATGTCDGLIGKMPTIKNVMQYATSRGIVVPDAPEYMPSTAPVVGGGELVFPCACSSGSGSATIDLPAEDPDGDSLTVTIATVPLFGSLATSAGTALSAGDAVTEGSVVYTQSSTLTTSDSFTYTASDGTVSTTATVTIINDNIAEADDRTISVDEDELKAIILGKSSNTNEYLQVVITALPSKGTLYQAAFEVGLTAAYDTMISDASDSSLVAITATGTTLSDARGIVLYAPEANEFESSGYAAFDYKYVDPATAGESNEATVTLNVLSVNDGPMGDAVSAEVADGIAAVIVTLTGSDVDNDASTPDAYDPMFAPHFFATIEEFPALGTLFQVDADDSTGTEINSEGTPTVTSYVSKILRYSSQYSVCGADCYSWASDQCTASNTGAVDSTMFPDVVDQVWGEATCALTKWAAAAFVGAPDFFPGYGDTVLGWDLSAENYGEEWIEVMFDTPLYIKDILVYETYKPGSIYKVSSAESYDDDNTVYCNENGAGGEDVVACSTDTEWTTLYSGTASPAGEAARIFEPNLCPYAYQTQFVRLDLETAAVPGWNNFDAAMISGSQETPTGLVLPQATLNEPNRVKYVPLAGIHGDDIDSFSFSLSDCVTSGAATTATLSIATPTAGSTSDVAFHTTSVDLSPNTNATVTVDFTDGWDYDSVNTLWPFGTDDLMWTVNSVDSTVSGMTADGTSLIAGASGILSGTMSMDVTLVGGDEIGGKISIWVSSPAWSSVTVRYLVDVNIAVDMTPCPAGTYGTGGADCFTCKDGTYNEFSGTTFTSADCIPCRKGEFSAGGMPCTPCVEPSTSLPGSSECTLCSIGFSFDVLKRACVACKTGQARCPGGDSLMVPSKGYWVAYDSIRNAHSIHECHRGTCSGGRDADLSRCWTATNYSTCDASEIQCRSGATGILCGSCKPDFTFNKIRNTCVTCTSSRHFGYFAIVLVCGFVIFWNAASQLPSVLRVVLHGDKTIDKLKHLLHFDIAKLKILWVTSTIVSTVPSTVEIAFPEPVQTLIYIYSFVEFDVWGGLGVECYAEFNYMSRAIATSIIPIAIVLGIWVVWGLRWLGIGARQNEQRTNVFSQHVHASLLISYLVLPTVVSVQFTSLRCIELEGLGRFLRADTSINCETAEYKSFVGKISFLLAVYLMCPLVYFALLYRVSEKLHAHKRASDESKEEQLLREAKLLMRQQSDPELRPLIFLFKGYKTKYWYWEVVESYRRITFMSALAALDTPSRRAFFAASLAMIGAWLYKEIAPYKQATTNVLNLVVQHQIFLIFVYASLLLHVEDAGYSGVLAGLDEGMVGTAICISNVSMFIICVFFAWRFIRQIRIQDEKIHEAMEAHAAQEAERAAEQGALPQVVLAFTTFAEVPAVSAIFERLNASAVQASELHRNRMRSTKNDRRSAAAKARRAARQKASKEQTLVMSIMSHEEDSLRSAKPDASSRRLGPLDASRDPQTSLATATESTSKRCVSDVPSLPNETNSNSDSSFREFESSSSVSRSLTRLPKISAAKIDNVTKFLAEVSEVLPKLQAEMNAFCSQKDIIKTCDAVLQTGASGFEDVYSAVYNLIVMTSDNDELESYAQTARALKLLSESGPGRGRAIQTVQFDLAELYLHAVEAYAKFSKVMNAIGQETGAKTEIAPLKQISRIFEKVLFDSKNRGMYMCESITDVVRAMITARSMGQLAKIAMAILESEQIVILRVKDRFEKPSAGGWRDLMINFYMSGDPNQHVCEVQIVVEKMVVARKGLEGHKNYARTRNAAEVLEYHNAVDPQKRCERVVYLRDVECSDAPELLHIGYEPKDLLKAGYETFEMIGSEGVTEADVLAAQESLALESQERKKSTGSSKAALGSFKRQLSRSSSKVLPGTN